MLNTKVWEKACGLARTVVEGVGVDDADGSIVVSVRADAKARGRCGRARHGVGHTRDFDDLAAWLTVRTSKSATCELLRVAWRTIGAIVTRVNADVESRIDRLDGLRRIGIDEISYKRGHRYLIVVVDHDTGHLVWAGPGRTDADLEVFFDELGDERAAELTHISADMAGWIARVVAKRAPNAVRCADAFHVVAWAIEALDVERRRAWNQASGRNAITTVTSQRGRARGTSLGIARARYALWKNPGDLTDNQRAQLDWIAKTDPRLHRAYLLKEGRRRTQAALHRPTTQPGLVQDQRRRLQPHPNHRTRHPTRLTAQGANTPAGHPPEDPEHRPRQPTAAALEHHRPRITPQTPNFRILLAARIRSGVCSRTLSPLVPQAASRTQE